MAIRSRQPLDLLDTSNSEAYVLSWTEVRRCWSLLTVPAEDDRAETEAICLDHTQELFLGHDLATKNSVDIHTWS